MARKMTLADLKLVECPGSDTQMVAILRAPYHMETGYAEIPEPNEREVRVKVLQVGICGSDLEAYRGTRAAEFVSIPARLGHEVSGVIDKVGEKVNGLKVGDQVTCRYVWGAYAQYIVCDPFNVKVLPPDFPRKAISLVEILPGVVHAAELARITASTDVVIMGQGVSGLIITQVLRMYSPRSLVVLDTKDRNLELARAYGATETWKIDPDDIDPYALVRQAHPDGFEVVIPCLLEGDGMVDAIDLAAMCGRIVMYGCIGVCNRPIDFFKVHRKRLEIYSTEPRRDIDMRRFFETGLQLVRDGIVNTEEIITDVYPLRRIQEAFEKRDCPPEGTIHVIIDCENA
ncbi:MAG: alcohol dehydrogenase catalytic domain-containing protein [Clostridia bacterium]|nr:alcohol dehydrogenase catalytic domain-containing protein [Clostridia bacterium]